MKRGVVEGKDRMEKNKKKIGFNRKKKRMMLYEGKMKKEKDLRGNVEEMMGESGRGERKKDEERKEDKIIWSACKSGRGNLKRRV